MKTSAVFRPQTSFFYKENTIKIWKIITYNESQEINLSNDGILVVVLHIFKN